MNKPTEENFSLLNLCSDIDFSALSVGSVLQAKSLSPDLFKFGTIDKSTIGLGNVTNDKQAKADFSSYTEKTDPINTDILAINDYEDSYSIKKAQLGNIINAGNYTDITINVSSSEFLNAYTSPKLLLAAPGTNKYYDIIYADMSMTYNSVPYNGFGINSRLILQDLPITTSTSYELYGDGVHNIATNKIIKFGTQTSANNILNKPLYLFNTWPYTNGNSPFIIFIRYRIITL
jgi:hypothetical protein